MRRMVIFRRKKSGPLGSLFKLVLFLAFVAMLFVTEMAVREFFFEQSLPVKLKKGTPPRGLALAGSVKPDFLWLGESFEFEIVNNSDQRLHTVVIELDDHTRCLAKSLEPEYDGDLPEGESVRFYSGMIVNNTKGFKKEGKETTVNEVPERVRLFADEGTFTWEIQER